MGEPRALPGEAIDMRGGDQRSVQAQKVITMLVVHHKQDVGGCWHVRWIPMNGVTDSRIDPSGILAGV